MEKLETELLFLKDQPRHQGDFPSFPTKPGKSALGTRLLKDVNIRDWNVLSV